VSSSHYPKEPKIWQVNFEVPSREKPELKGERKGLKGLPFRNSITCFRPHGLEVTTMSSSEQIREAGTQMGEAAKTKKCKKIISLTVKEEEEESTEKVGGE